MKRLIPLITALALPAFLTAAEDGFAPLFNGQNLDGWHVAAKDVTDGARQNFFTVSDGAIHVYASHDQGSKQPFCGLITDKSYRDYHLSFEYRWGEKKFAPRTDAPRDAGVCFHLHGPEVIWPGSVEIQIQEGDTGDAWIIHSQASSKILTRSSQNYSPKGDVVTRGDKANAYTRFPRSLCWEVPGWNRIEIIVKGDKATYLVNGHIVNEVFDMRQPDAATGHYVPLTSGRILLQGEGAEIFYRDIKIKSL